MKIKYLLRKRKKTLLFCVFILIFLMIFYLLISLFGKNKNSNASLKIVFRYDDYGIRNDSVSTQILSILQKYNIPALISVIPCITCKDLGDFSYIEINETDKQFLKNTLFDIGLHGFSHKNLSQSTISEFAGTPLSEQILLIQKGKKILQQNLKRKISCFIPPWNSYDCNTVNALSKSDINLMSAKRVLKPLECITDDNKLLFIPYTITLKEFISKFYKNDLYIPFLSEKNAHAVVMLHPYDFFEQNEKRGFLKIDEFRRFIKEIKETNAIQIISLQKMIENSDSSYGRFEHNPSCVVKIFSFKLFDMTPFYYYGRHAINFHYFFAKLLNVILNFCVPVAMIIFTFFIGKKYIKFQKHG